MPLQIKTFSGEAADVERDFNAWAPEEGWGPIPGGVQIALDPAGGSAMITVLMAPIAVEPKVQPVVSLPPNRAERRREIH